MQTVTVPETVSIPSAKEEFAVTSEHQRSSTFVTLVPDRLTVFLHSDVSLKISIS